MNQPMSTDQFSAIEVEARQLEAAHSAHELALMLATEQAEQAEVARQALRRARVVYAIVVIAAVVIAVSAVVNYLRITDLQERLSDLTQTTSAAAPVAAEEV